MADSTDKDKSTFTEGVYPATPVGGVVNDTPAGDVAEDNQGALRMTPKRALHINLRDQAGAEVGLEAKPVGVQLVAKTTLGALIPLVADDQGRIFISPTTVGTKLSVVKVQTLSANAVNFQEYTVGAGLTLQATKFYAGGRGAGVAALIRHDAAVVNDVLNGAFESAPEVAAWAAVTGTFTAPSPDLSTVQKFLGASSMRWIYSASTTMLRRQQTFATAMDITGHRYLRVRFYNDGAVGTTRTLTIVLTSGTSTRTYTLTGTLGSAPFLSNVWLTMTCDLEFPTSTTGAAFDPSVITAMSVAMQDGAARAGTVYWDAFRLEDSLASLHRVYFGAGTTAPAIDILPSDDIPAGGTLYLYTANLTNSRNEFTTVLKGVLI